MKAGVRVWLLLVAVFACFFAQAQLMEEDTARNEPFFKAKKFDSKCFVGFEASAGQYLKKKAGMNLGFSLNWVINHKFVVSAKYHTLTTPLNVRYLVAPDRTDSISLNHHFAGLGFSYILFDSKKFSFQPELSGGWASVKFKRGNGTFRKDFGLIIPAVYGTYNASKHFRFGIGLNYRLAIAAAYEGLSSADISGVSGVVFIRIGTF